GRARRGRRVLGRRARLAAGPAAGRPVSGAPRVRGPGGGVVRHASARVRPGGIALVVPPRRRRRPVPAPDRAGRDVDRPLRDRGNAMRARILVVAILAAGLLAGPWPQPAHASWVSTNCRVWSHLDDGLRRMDARTYAGYAARESYEWGGGCWNNDDLDDTPAAPDSGGEGPDCSGLVFKTWELLQTYGAAGFRWYSRW